MSPTRYTASQAVARARAYLTYRIAMCLNFVWNCLDAPRSAGLNDANAAWYAAKMRHTTGTPPAGAPVYWGGGKHGHIAMSLGNGYCRSTDVPEKGRVGTIAIATLTRTWGIPYRGWSEDYAGHPIPGVAKGVAKPPAKKPPVKKPPVKPPVKKPGGVGVSAPVLKLGSKGNAVKKLQGDLLRVFPDYAGPIRSGGGPITTYGPGTVKVVKEFQKRVKLPQTGVVDAKTWAQLAKSGIKP